MLIEFRGISYTLDEFLAVGEALILFAERLPQKALNLKDPVKNLVQDYQLTLGLVKRYLKGDLNINVDFDRLYDTSKNRNRKIGI